MDWALVVTYSSAKYYTWLKYNGIARYHIVVDNAVSVWKW